MLTSFTRTVGHRLRSAASRPLFWGISTASLPLLLFLTHCSAVEDAQGPEVLGSVQQAAVPARSCSSKPICTSAANLPFCADPLTSFCNTTFNECMYRIKNDQMCPCIAGDMRECPLPGGGTGVQKCLVDDPKTHTWWDTCYACSSGGQ